MRFPIITNGEADYGRLCHGCTWSARKKFQLFGCGHADLDRAKLLWCPEDDVEHLQSCPRARKLLVESEQAKPEEIG